jgi:hypothetical protein
MNSKNLGFGRNGRNLPNRRGWRHGFISRLEVGDETQPSTQTHGRNRGKTPQIMRSRIGPKYSKITKMKTLQHNIVDELTQKHDYIDANQEFTADPRRSPPSLPHLIGN